MIDWSTRRRQINRTNLYQIDIPDTCMNCDSRPVFMCCEEATAFCLDCLVGEGGLFYSYSRRRDNIKTNPLQAVCPMSTCSRTLQSAMETSIDSSLLHDDRNMIIDKDHIVEGLKIGLRRRMCITNTKMCVVEHQKQLRANLKSKYKPIQSDLQRMRQYSLGIISNVDVMFEVPVSTPCCGHNFENFEGCFAMSCDRCKSKCKFTCT